MSPAGRPRHSLGLPLFLPEEDALFLSLALLELMNVYLKDGNEWRALQCERLSARIDDEIHENRKALKASEAIPPGDRL